MDKNYSLKDLIYLMEEDLIHQETEYLTPRPDIITNILSYAAIQRLFLPSLNREIEICLN